MDNYIDRAEALRYNNFAVSTLGALQDLSPEIPLLLSELSTYSSRLTEVQTKAEDTRSTARTIMASRREQGEEVSTRLGRLLDKLKLQILEGATFDLYRMYPTGTRLDIGKSVADRQAALTRVLAGLAQYKANIQDSQMWIDELTTLSRSFGSVVSEESSVSQTKLAQSDQLINTLRSWKQMYGAAKLIVRGVLRRAGRESEWRDYFMDAQVAGNTATSTEETESVGVN